MTSGPKPGAETDRLHLTYDAWNRLVAAYADDEGEAGDLIAEYQYDGQGRRIAKIVREVDGETVTYERTDYLYDEAWQAIEERTDSFEVLGGEGGALETPAEVPGVQWLWDVRYVDSPVLRWRSVSGTLNEVLYYCNDANMNVTALVNTSGTVVERYVYDAYGKTAVYDDDWSDTVGWSSSKKNEVLYCGYRFDPETGLDQVRYRYYHPTLGRWSTRDPMKYSNDINLCAYAHENPASTRDFSGLADEDWGSWSPGDWSPNSCSLCHLSLSILETLAPEGYGYVGVWGLDFLKEHLASAAVQVGYATGEMKGGAEAKYSPYTNTVKFDTNINAITNILNSPVVQQNVVHELVHAFDDLQDLYIWNGLWPDWEASDALAYAAAGLVGVAAQYAKGIEDLIQGRTQAGPNEKQCAAIRQKWRDMWVNFENLFNTVMVQWRDGERLMLEKDVWDVREKLHLRISCKPIEGIWNAEMSLKHIPDDRNPGQCCRVKCPADLRKCFQ